MIARPSVAGAVHETVTLPSPGITIGAAGFAGTPYGVADDDGVDVGPVPLELWAFTVNVYDVPFVNVGTVQVSGPCVHVQVFDPGLEVTV